MDPRDDAVEKLIEDAFRADGLTQREAEAARLAGSGLTNVAVARAMAIDRKAVGRYVSVSYSKLRSALALRDKAEAGVPFGRTELRALYERLRAERTSLFGSTTLGITRVYRDRNGVDEYRLQLLKAASRASMMAIAPDIPSPNGMVEVIRDCVTRGSSLKILAWDYEMYASDPSQNVGGIPGLISPISEKEMRATQDRLRGVQRLALEETSGSVEIRLYRDTPSWYIQIFDDRMLAEPYLYRQRGDQTFVLEIERLPQRNDTPFAYFERHFETIFEFARAL